MGEATYYGKLRFPSEAAAKKALVPFKRFCVECSRAEWFWQQHRDKDYPRWGRLKPYRGKRYKTDEEFWDAFEKKFPRVSEYLKGAGNDPAYGKPIWRGDRNNGLAGMIEPIGAEEDVNYIRQDDNEISWSSTVWHFADWDPIIAYVEARFGCEGRWLSDEYLDVEYLLDAEFN